MYEPNNYYGDFLLTSLNYLLLLEYVLVWMLLYVYKPEMIVVIGMSKETMPEGKGERDVE